ncbi:MAG: alkaline phosphatase PhoX [Gaiellaceae bacterium]
MKRRTIVSFGVLAGIVLMATAATASTSVKPYVVAVGDEYEVDALFSVNDQVPVLGGAPGAMYRMVGIPDGLGAHSNGNGTSTLFMNHELTFTALSEPYVGGTWKNEGALVSKWILDADGDPIAGKRAYDKAYLGDTLIGDAATNDPSNPTRAFGRFCSGSLAGSEHGFDRPIYFANEEQAGTSTFDGKGGLAVAIFENNGVGEAHGLPGLGRFAWENSLVQRNTGARTVIMSMEDGPSNQDPRNDNSQLYMYVGTKSTSGTVLQTNGLVGGTLYVFRSKNKNQNSEFEVRNGTLAGEWVALPGAGGMTDVQLEAAADAAGAMVFARPEDGAFNPVKDDEYFFVTTGDVPTSGPEQGNYLGNSLGRLYSLKLNPSDPTRDATLSVVYNADEIIAAGGDIAISPDNMDASSEYVMINEDGTGPSRPVMAAKGRDGSIWRFDLKPSGGVDVSSAIRIAELDPPGRSGSPPDPVVNPGIWETSGIIDASHLFGPDTWLSDVQAHLPTPAPGGTTVTVEDGQLFLLRPTN